MQRLTKGMSAISTAIGAIALLLMMSYVVVSTLMRYAVNEPLPAVAEVTSRWFLIPLAFAGIVAAQQARQHIRVDMLSGALRGRGRSIVQVTAHLITAGFLLLVLWYGFEAANEARDRGEYGVDSGWPIWPSRYFVPLFAALTILVLARQAVRAAVGKDSRGRSEEEGPDERSAL